MNEQRAVEPRREGRIFARGAKRTLWIEWYDHEGRQHRESTRSRDPRVADARLRAKLTAKDRGERYIPQAKRLTVGALLDGLKEHHEAAGTKCWRRLSQCVTHLAEHFGRDAKVSTVDYPAIESYVRARRKSAKPATVNMEMTVLKSAFKVAAKRGQVAVIPVFPVVKVRNTRTVMITDAELAALLDALPKPVAVVVEFSSLTGWRLMECLNLLWDRVDFDARTVTLQPHETKSGHPRVFPFRTSPRLAALLYRQRQERWRIERQRGVEVEYVFTREGRRIRDIDDAWHGACRRVGLVDSKERLADGKERPARIFHDLRRYAATRLVKAGVARSEAMALMGHQSESMFTRYALNELSMLEQAVGKVAALDSIEARGGEK